MSFSSRSIQTHRRSFFAAALLTVFVASLAEETMAQERKFVVMLAAPIKSMREADVEVADLPNTGAIFTRYFDRVDTSLNSFAEYWNEISYGNVNVSGDVFGWVEVPWPILPLGDFSVDEGAETIGNLNLPFKDLNGQDALGFEDGNAEGGDTYDEFAGESVPDAQNQMIFIDYNGELPGTATPGFPPTQNRRTPGFVDFWPDGQTPCWTPGERFADINGDGQYDALLEATMDGWSTGNPDPACSRDGIIEDDEVCEATNNPPLSGALGDGDGEWDYPEPFEDFIVIYLPDPPDPEQRWIKLDPSYKNTFEGDDPIDGPQPIGSRRWAVQYIRRNYPGDAGTPNFPEGTAGSGFMARFGNDKYDGPDQWTEVGNNKLQMQGGNQMMRGLGSVRSPEPSMPSSALYPPQYPRWDYATWWANYWVDKHLNAMVNPPPTPEAPAWPPTMPTAGGGGTPNIPNMKPFDPQLPSQGQLPNPNDLRAFNPNVGGTNARKGVRCVDGAPNEPEMRPDPPEEGDPPAPTCNDDPNVPPAGQDWCDDGNPDTPAGEEWEPQYQGGDDCQDCYNNLTLCVDRENVGNGEVDPRASAGVDIFNGNIERLPDRLDSNNDSEFDYYDGPAEFEDLPSSIYHARSISGVGYGGDTGFGEVTSTRNESIFGEDIGTGDPTGPSTGGDQVLPAAGPLAFGIHGANGFDGGNQVTIEWLTWRKDGEDTDPVDILKRDFNLDGLLDLGEVRNAGTENYAIDLNPGSPNDGGDGSDYPFNRTRLVEDTVEALDRSVDWDEVIMQTRPVCSLNEGLAPTFIPDLLAATLPSPGGSLALVLSGFRTTDGQVAGFLGFIGEDFPMVNGMAFDPAATVWLATDTATDKLLELSLDQDGNLVVTEVGNLGFDNVDGLDFDPNTNTLYGSDTTTDQLLRIDRATGAATAIGAFGFSDVQGLGFDPNANILYGIDNASRRLIRINTNTGLGTAVGTQPTGTPEIKGLAFDPTSDTLYGVSTSGSGVLVKINTSTGVASLVNNTVNFLHSTVFVPGGLYQDGLAPGGRGLFQLAAPGMDTPIQVVEDGDPNTAPISPIFFSDFATALDARGENGEPASSEDFAIGLMAHEWLHVWEAYPDLYDYDVYINGIENRPVGFWDIMAGGLVHPSPFLKEFGEGICGIGTEHEPWIQTTDLLDVLTPFQDVDVTLTDFAFNPSDSVFYFSNPNILGERFYFWRLTRAVYTNPRINFSRSLPSDGIMIMHTDFGQNFAGFGGNLESFPLQQRIGTHFAYQVIQGDGLQQLENGVNSGDGGDPFPGTSGRRQWTEESTPSSRWYGQIRSGIEIRDLVTNPTFSIATFHWNPRVVPELEFLRPPGGAVVGGNYMIGYEAWDKDGGTHIEFYWDDNNEGYETEDLDGSRLIGAPASKTPGFVEQQHAVPLSQLSDGTFYFFARLVPGPGQDGRVDPEVSKVRADLGNRGRGHFKLDPANSGQPANANKEVLVDLTKSNLELWTVACVNDAIAGSEEWEVRGSLSGVQNTHALTGQFYTSDNGDVSFRILSDAITGTGSISVNPAGQVVLVDLTADFVAPDFKPTDRVRVTVNGVTSFPVISSVSDNHTLVLATNPGVGANIPYRVHSFFDDNGNDPDKFTFITTGLTAYSQPIVVENGTVVQQLSPVIQVIFPDDENGTGTNPKDRVPCRVIFNASQSRDENGNLNNPNIDYEWDFGDGDTAVGVQVEHTYLTSFPCPTGVTVTVTATNPGASSTGEDITGEAETVVCIDPPDTDGDDVDDEDDNCPALANPGQENADADTLGDVCDNCPNLTNEDQADFDGDDIGDVCDSDRDGDGSQNSVDNCPLIPNANQADNDGDGIGNVCDNCPNNFNPTQGGDSDGDGLPDLCDNCPGTPNASQNDADNDDIGDVCDVCPNNVSSVNEPDSDSDGIGNACDNCVDVPNGNQANADQDPFGDACDNCPNDPGKKEPGVCGCGTADQDRDGDGVPDCVIFGPRPPDTDEDGVDDTLDECPFDASKTTEGICGCNIPDGDRDADGVVDCIDNCPDDANPGQEDGDSNNIGDACQPDGNGGTGGPGPNPIPGCGEGAVCPAAPAVSMAPFAMVGIAMMRSRYRRRRSR